MKCQKCGAEMGSGHLYCEKCGAEFQIVPDFEPEIENSIAESLSDISETIEEHISAKVSKLTSKVKTMKAPSFSLIFTLVVVFSLFVFIGYSKYTNSTNYQNKQALDAIHKQDYYQAAQIYESIRKNNMEDAYWYTKEAETLLLMQEDDKAYQLVTQALALDKNTEFAYRFLINYLIDAESYLEVKRLLEECNLEKIRNEYQEYLCLLPTINYESGSYDQALEISFSKDYEGTIYYTLDNKIPPPVFPCNTMQ